MHSRIWRAALVTAALTLSTRAAAQTTPQTRTLANGHRISGTASFASNGGLAGFSGSPVHIEITSNGVVPFANLSVTFGDAAASHFGPQLKGVVTYEP